MLDLWIAIAAVSVVSIVVGIISARFAPSDRQSQMLGITVVTVGMFLFVFYAAGHLIWATWIEDSAAIIWSNPAPLLGAIAAGFCAKLADTPAWRRWSMAVALSVVSLAAVLWPFLGIAIRSRPPGGNQWQGPVAMQTSWASCSPAAAATFLTAGSIPVTEATMIVHCLTDTAGTPTLGLYRGVKIVANNHRRDVVARISTQQELLENNDWPALLLVELPESGVEDPRYAAQWGWIPGMGHTVVALGRSSDGILIADPAVGREYWTERDLSVLWHGESIHFRAIP